MEKGISCVGICNCFDFTCMLLFHKKIMMEVEVCPNFGESGIDHQNQEPDFGESGIDCQNQGPNFGELGADAKIGIPMTPRKTMESYLTNTPNNFKKFAQNSKSRDFAKCPSKWNSIMHSLMHSNVKKNINEMLSK